MFLKNLLSGYRIVVILLLGTFLAVGWGCSDNPAGLGEEEEQTEEENNNGNGGAEPLDAPGYPDNYADYADFSNRNFWGPYNVHDPSCIVEAGWTYCFSTDASYGNEADKSKSHIQVRRSEDLLHWEFVGWAISNIPNEAFQHVTAENDGQQPDRIWAPFIMKWEDTFRLYYSVSIFGSNGSYIGLLTSESLEGPWQDQGGVVSSTHADPMNAIDPTVVVDPDTERHWFAYGSYWTGIYLLELDSSTGKPLSANDKGQKIASSAMQHNAIEGPEIIFNEDLGQFFLFVSYGDLMDEYSVRAGRADHPEGPYLDFNGNDMAENTNNFPVLTSPYSFQNHAGWQGLGHNTVFKVDGQWYSMQQGRLGSNIHMMVMHLRKIQWTNDGWPVFSPERYGGVSQEEITDNDLHGTWEEVVLNPLSGSGAKNRSQILEFNQDGTISDKDITWRLEGERKLIVEKSADDTSLELLLHREWDWELDKSTILYSGLRNDGLTIWGKKVE